MTSAISIRGVTKTFGPKLAVNNIDLVVPTGSVCGFIGPNGAGKTTTIRMIMSILFPDRGEITVLGKKSAVESKDRIGYLPEERGLYRKMKVGAFLVYVGRLKGVPDSVLKPRITSWLDRVGLADVIKKRCEELSKGMQQKVQFLASIIHEPDLVILDEPFSGLDPVNRRMLRDLIDELHHKGKTIIFSTHAMFEAEQLCDHLFMIHRGNKVLDASLEEIRNRFDPKTLIVEPMSPADADRLGRVEGVAGVRTGREAGGTAGTYELMLRDGEDPSEVMARLAAGVPMRRIELKRVTLEDVFISLAGPSPEEAENMSRLREGALAGSAE